MIGRRVSRACTIGLMPKSQRSEGTDPQRSLPSTSLLDVAGLPIEELAEFSRREGSRPRPIYGAHRWFARRFGTAMRALLVASVSDADDDFWDAFYGREGAADLTGLHVLDPFVGGGTILYEAQRLGAAVTGVDVDPVACAISGFEFSAASAPDPSGLVEEMWRTLGKSLAERYRTVVDGEERIGLHYFWVQTIECGGCDETFRGHPNHLLGVAGDDHWTICPDCGSVQRQAAGDDRVDCNCGSRARLGEGTVRKGVATCPRCGHSESLIDNARRCGRPRWELCAIESLPAGHGRNVPFRDRTFAAPSNEDLALYADATSALNTVKGKVPRRTIIARGRADSRLHAYGYRRYSELFNDRQLLHLVLTAAAVRQLPEADRTAAGLALSNHTVSNCMLTTYTTKWRQATPLFAVRSFRHSSRPVELNPWVDGPGRGTFPNALRRVGAAVRFAQSPQEFTANGYTPTPALPAGPSRVLNTDSRSLESVADGSVDLVVTDPPYLDNIAYSELADFFVPWLAEVGLTSRSRRAGATSLAASGRNAHSAAVFAEGLSACLAEASRTLKPRGRIVFTFQHSSPNAWLALATAISAAGLQAVNVFPMKGDGDRGLHHHHGSTTWDAVFVLRPGATPKTVAPSVGRRQQARLEQHTAEWVERLDLGGADAILHWRAALAAGAAGFLRCPGGDRQTPIGEVMRGEDVS
jgi:adenine-specific DNA methylase